MSVIFFIFIIFHAGKWATQPTSWAALSGPLDDDTYLLLIGLATTRRMKRAMGPEFGFDGEFFVENDDETGVDDVNQPPRTQPGLRCQWLVQEDRQTIMWDEGEKFYAYFPWIKYIIESVLKPRGYVLDGQVSWQGEDPKDHGVISVIANAAVSKRSRAARAV